MTDRNDSDPGITILEVIAFLAENVLYGYEERDRVVVRVNGERWERVPSFADASPDAAVFTLDASTAAVAFGDGKHGRVPEPGSTISVRYRMGSGEYR